jgi:O-antigen ligase
MRAHHRHPFILHKRTINPRLVLVCMVAASVGLSMALISIGKLFLLLGAVATLALAARQPQEQRPTLAGAWTPAVALAAFFAFALSLLWTSAPLADALGSIGKYGKLLAIAALLLLLRDRREARFAVAAFFIAQVFLILSSWLLYAHVPVPWATSNMAATQYAVFSSYLDQGIQGAVLAALLWHLRGLMPGRYGPHIAVLLAVVALLNVFFVLSGRSGHVVAIALLSLAIMWQLPRGYRIAVLALPFVIVLALFFGSSKVRARLTEVVTEVQSFTTATQATTSSGIRLALWRRALQITAEHPLKGTGVGSWTPEYNRLQHAQFADFKDIDGKGNPHQEYLHWAVQLGIPGVLLFLGLLLAVLRDAMRMERPYARATVSALVGLAVACLFNSSIYDALIGDFLCVTIGLMLALGLRSEPAAPPAVPSTASA